jgi:hypothetical protein
LKDAPIIVPGQFDRHHYQPIINSKNGKNQGEKCGGRHERIGIPAGELLMSFIKKLAISNGARRTAQNA